MDGGGALSSLHQSLLQIEAPQKYLLDANVGPIEHQLLKKLREETKARIPKRCITNVHLEEALLLSIILKALKAKRTIEVGVFTGYPLLAAALALPDDAKVTAIDTSREWYEIGLQFIKEAGVEHKIDFIESDAVPALDKLICDSKEVEQMFDFGFVDAEKSSYWEYHERLLKLVRIGGLICYDNALWLGSAPQSLPQGIPEAIDFETEVIAKFNGKIASDKRVELLQVCVGDGLTICRRIA